MALIFQQGRGEIGRPWRGGCTIFPQEMKTVRFSQVVAKCGRPVVHDQWVAAEKDMVLKKALKDHRVMTVHIHTVGNKKDHGEMGLVKKGQHMLLIFPKSLQAVEGRRVVGIDYDLLKETEVRAVKKKKPAPESGPSARSKAKASSSEAVLHLFHPEEAHAEKQAKTTRKAPKRQSSSRASKRPSTRPKAVASVEAAGLRRQIQKAMKQLQSGKAVMAYHTLEKSLEG